MHAHTKCQKDLPARTPATTHSLNMSNLIPPPPSCPTERRTKTMMRRWPSRTWRFSEMGGKSTATTTRMTMTLRKHRRQHRTTQTHMPRFVGPSSRRRPLQLPLQLQLQLQQHYHHHRRRRRRRRRRRVRPRRRLHLSRRCGCKAASPVPRPGTKGVRCLQVW